MYSDSVKEVRAGASVPGRSEGQTSGRGEAGYLFAHPAPSSRLLRKEMLRDN